MGRYEDFWAMTELALTFAWRRLGLEVSAAKRRRLMDAYLAFDAFPEVREALVRLRDLPCAILSNGAPRMLEAVVAHSGLSEHLPRGHPRRPGANLQAPSGRLRSRSRPARAHPRHHRLRVIERLGCRRGQGVRLPGRVNRLAAPLDDLGVSLDLEVRDLTELAQALGR
jgi:2-haloacid dehalogenase